VLAINNLNDDTPLDKDYNRPEDSSTQRLALATMDLQCAATSAWTDVLNRDIPSNLIHSTAQPTQDWTDQLDGDIPVDTSSDKDDKRLALAVATTSLHDQVPRSYREAITFPDAKE